MVDRLPSRVLDWNSPYKMLYGVEPDLSVLRPFGCLAYSVNLHPSRDKFDSRSNKCVFLGFDSGYKGYLLYDIDHSKILISRDVKFDTNVHPFSVTGNKDGMTSSEDSSHVFPASHPVINDIEPSQEREHQILEE